MLRCTRFGLLAVLCSTPIFQPRFSSIRSTVFSDTSLLNLYQIFVYIQGAESLYSVFCLHFFINGIISAWEAGYFFLSWFNHRLLVSPYLALKLQYHLFVFFWVTRLTFSLQKWKCKWVLLLSSGIATEQLLSSLPSGFFRSVLYM